MLSAMFSALGIVLLFVGGALGDLDLTISAVASLIVLISIIEMGVSYGFMVYAATSALALLLFPSYFITPMYVGFVGLYPMIKYFSEKLKKPIAYLIKFASMNLVLAFMFVLAVKVYAIDVHDITVFGKDLGRYAVLLTYILANITLLLYDYCLTKLIVLYNTVIAKKLGIYKLFR